jgi:hypothetical protein
VNGAGFVLNSVWALIPQVNRLGIRPSGSGMSTNIPAWLAVGVVVTNTANFVQFDAMFTDTNSAEGLLSVYWNTNQVGIIDERISNSGLQTYRFTLPSAAGNGLYTLSFRLDSFNNTASGITVTNVSTGFAGVTQSILLGISFTNSAPVLQLTAATNFSYLIQSSSNLLQWTPTALLLATNGTAQFVDSGATNSRIRFYRALSPR